MRKQRVEYSSPIDALSAIIKRLHGYELQFGWDSEEFYDQFKKGKLEDSIDFVEWGNDYQHFLSLKIDLEKKLQNVA